MLLVYQMCEIYLLNFMFIIYLNMTIVVPNVKKKKNLPKMYTCMHIMYITGNYII